MCHSPHSWDHQVFTAQKLALYMQDTFSWSQDRITVGALSTDPIPESPEAPGMILLVALMHP